MLSAAECSVDPTPGLTTDSTTTQSTSRYGNTSVGCVGNVFLRMAVETDIRRVVRLNS